MLETFSSAAFLLANHILDQVYNNKSDKLDHLTIYTAATCPPTCTFLT